MPNGSDDVGSQSQEWLGNCPSLRNKRRAKSENLKPLIQTLHSSEASIGFTPQLHYSVIASPTSSRPDIKVPFLLLRIPY
jgi:hypothetical protein